MGTLRFFFQKSKKFFQMVQRCSKNRLKGFQGQEQIENR